MVQTKLYLLRKHSLVPPNPATPPIPCKVTHRINHARQLALKLIANVTFGYTAASATGRMPCSDIADAIVLTGRDTLERSIRLVDTHPEWGARVVPSLLCPTPRPHYPNFCVIPQPRADHHPVPRLHPPPLPYV